MTDEEVWQRIKRAADERQQLLEKVLTAARAVVPVLKDAGRNHSARELDELLFQSDALDQEMSTLMVGRAPEILAYVMQKVRGRR